MSSRFYNEYIKVDPNFIPVFSRSSDKTYPDKWQSFYPHESFKVILKDVVESLEKQNPSKDKSVWMSGAYGTGKTYASFVVKHIFEDSIESVEPYFARNGMESLLARVKGIRAKGKILVVQRSSSAGINTQDKLFNGIVESVRKAVTDAGLSYIGSESLADKVITMLKNPETSAFNFQGVFNKYKAVFTDYSSVESIIRDLDELDDDERLDLLDTIINVAANEGFNWSMSPNELIEWLDDVRKGNNLYSIVFVWDEFTEYFRNNRDNITGLQEIAMASSSINFYFFLITHSSAGQLIQNKSAMKTIEARFKLDNIELEESTAFKLLANAIHKNGDLADEWDNTRNQLWDGVKRGTVDVIKNKDLTVSDGDFINLMPTHPYSAYLLKFIAKDISSNQRTIFQFLSGDFSGDDTKTNFKWFIENNCFEFGKWNYLTVDYLWDYFFTSDNVDLESSFIQTISHYNNYAPLCDDSDSMEIGKRRRRILKCVLLLYALQIKNGAESRMGATSLMRPTLENIRACFVGTPIESYVEQDLNFFDSKGIIGKIDNGREVLYVMNATAVDTERMKEMVEKTRQEIPFEKIIDDSNIGINEHFLPDKKGFLTHRLQIYNISVVNARQVCEKAKSEICSYKIPTFYLFAKNELEQGNVKDTIKLIYEKIGSKCIVVDFTASPLSDTRFDKFIEGKAKERYFSSLKNNDSQVQLAQKGTKAIISEWTKILLTTTLNVYSDSDKPIPVVGGANLRKQLKVINSSKNFFGCGLEEFVNNDSAFEETGFKETVVLMALGKMNLSQNYGYLRGISTKLETDGIWNAPKYWETSPNHTVSRMKQAINAVIDKSFKDSSMVSFSAIWETLTKSPFGLMPNVGSVFVLSFLLKEYADSKYYKRDNTANTVALSSEVLSELIYATVKGTPKAQNQYIVKQTPAQTKFCQTVGEIFKIAKEKRNSVDDIAKNLNIFLTNNNYPLWAIKYYIEEDLYDHTYKEAMVQLTVLLCEFVKPESKIGRERSKVVEEICAIFKKNVGIEDVYKGVVLPENMRTGMGYYIAQYKPELISIAKSLHIEQKEYLEMLNKKLSPDSSYLWEIGDTDNQINNIYIDLKLISDINLLLATKQRSYADACKALKDRLNTIRVPNSLFVEFYPNLKLLVERLFAIINNERIDKRMTSSIISSLADEFITFFENQRDTFQKAITKVLGQPVTDEEYEHLLQKVPSGIFFKTVDEFGLAMKNELGKFRKSKKTKKMYEAWEKATKTKDPAQWSTTYGIPVLCMFEGDIVQAQKVFDALNGTTTLPSESDIDNAIVFLNSGALTILNDTSSCEKKFVDFFAGEYAYVINSAAELGDIIREIAGTKVYDWYAKANGCKGRIKEFAAQRYKTKYCDKAKEKVKKLSAEEAQRYLNELIEKDPLLGINILKG